MHRLRSNVTDTMYSKVFGTLRLVLGESFNSHYQGLQTGSPNIAAGARRMTPNVCCSSSAT